LIPQALNNDQRRELINSQQRFLGWQDARQRLNDVRGSMVWKSVDGKDYLARSSYDKLGIRRQTSLGPRSQETERIKAEFEHGRDEAEKRYKELDAALARQAAINRALGLGRVPLAAARVLRSLNNAHLLGNGVRVVGTNAIYAFEAAAGVMVDSGITATGDIDLLFDSRHAINFVVSDDVPERSLIKVLRQFDSSFQRMPQEYRAQNAEGYLVDLIKPARNPPWKKDASSLAPGTDDLVAAEIEGLIWLENAPAFESTVLDDRGVPLRIVTPDPRVWAAHKLWLSRRDGREPVKKQRDAEQAATIAKLVVDHFPHLPYVAADLKSLPKDVFEAARPLFG
jgi:hypothetical protein